METTPKQDHIVVTGFGLFRDHKSNPSWEAIKDGALQIDRPNLKVITKKISVEYKAVDRDVEELWNIYKPILMVHIGLHDKTPSIRIEKQARHGPYINDDVAKYAPHKELRLYSDEVGPKAAEQNKPENGGESNIRQMCYTCKPCQFDSSQTCIAIERVCSELNELYAQKRVPIPFSCSDDAGLYVCEYIYLKSLQICDKTIFIHVPNVGDLYTLDDIRKSIKIAIETILDDLNEV